jgi:hypothetical protein
MTWIWLIIWDEVIRHWLNIRYLTKKKFYCKVDLHNLFIISKVCVKNENFTLSPKVMLKNWFIFEIISSFNEDIISNILFDIISSLNEDIISNMNQSFNVIFEKSAKFPFLIHTVILKFIIFLLHVKIVEIH